MAEGKSFAEAVQTTLCNYHATQDALTGTSPVELMMGRKLILSLDNLKPLKLLNMRLPFGGRIRCTKQKALKSYADIKCKSKLRKLGFAFKSKT